MSHCAMTVTPITASEAWTLSSSMMIPVFLWLGLITFAFVSTIISVSLFLKWQQSQSTSISFANHCNDQPFAYIDARFLPSNSHPLYQQQQPPPPPHQQQGYRHNNSHHIQAIHQQQQQQPQVQHVQQPVPVQVQRTRTPPQLPMQHQHGSVSVQNVVSSMQLPTQPVPVPVNKMSNCTSSIHCSLQQSFESNARSPLRPQPVLLPSNISNFSFPHRVSGVSAVSGVSGVSTINGINTTVSTPLTPNNAVSPMASSTISSMSNVMDSSFPMLAPRRSTSTVTAVPTVNTVNGVNTVNPVSAVNTNGALRFGGSGSVVTGNCTKPMTPIASMNCGMSFGFPYESSVSGIPNVSVPPSDDVTFQGFNDFDCCTDSNGSSCSSMSSMSNSSHSASSTSSGFIGFSQFVPHHPPQSNVSKLNGVGLKSLNTNNNTVNTVNTVNAVNAVNTNRTNTASSTCTMNGGGRESTTPPSPPRLQPLSHVQVILDWDDTLFPTSFTVRCMENGKMSSADLDDKEHQLLNELQTAVMLFLVELVQLFGGHNVAIVTNATHNWVVSESSQMYRGLFKNINHFMRHHGIPVISATDSYGNKHSTKAKSLAFMDVLKGKRAISNVISVGDSKDEFEAVHSVCSVFRSASEGSPRRREIHYYRCKLMERPSLKQMIVQILSLRTFNFQHIAQLQMDRTFHFD